ncbi:hypothetical protein PAPYR_3282 [Paratrimastix pyriformis]|uniref:Uncharacterized protein n=1 Tax=Paratrimastix pyriformis TaxID=342808 RepID=A0ABQ8URD6_9EUKA|nr:hypothetical protein PAPYR_3282 [Paratrimastix pyriformis]
MAALEAALRSGDLAKSLTSPLGTWLHSPTQQQRRHSDFLNSLDLSDPAGYARRLLRWLDQVETDGDGKLAQELRMKILQERVFMLSDVRSCRHPITTCPSLACLLPGDVTVRWLLRASFMLSLAAPSASDLTVVGRAPHPVGRGPEGTLVTSHPSSPIHGGTTSLRASIASMTCPPTPRTPVPPTSPFSATGGRPDTPPTVRSESPALLVRRASSPDEADIPSAARPLQQPAPPPAQQQQPQQAHGYTPPPPIRPPTSENRWRQSGLSLPERALRHLTTTAGPPVPPTPTPSVASAWGSAQPRAASVDGPPRELHILRSPPARPHWPAGSTPTPAAATTTPSPMATPMPTPLPLQGPPPASPSSTPPAFNVSAQQSTRSPAVPLALGTSGPGTSLSSSTVGLGFMAQQQQQQQHGHPGRDLLASARVQQDVMGRLEAALADAPPTARPIVAFVPRGAPRPARTSFSLPLTPPTSARLPSGSSLVGGPSTRIPHQRVVIASSPPAAGLGLGAGAEAGGAAAAGLIQLQPHSELQARAAPLGRKRAPSPAASADALSPPQQALALAATRRTLHVLALAGDPHLPPNMQHPQLAQLQNPPPQPRTGAMESRPVHGVPSLCASQRLSAAYP